MRRSDGELVGQMEFGDVWPAWSDEAMRQEVVQRGLERESAIFQATLATHVLEDAMLAWMGHHGASLADLQLATGIPTRRLRRHLRNASRRVDR